MAVIDNPDTWERVGATVRMARELRGLKPDELANRLTISRAYLANIEAGRKKLTPVLLAKVSAVLDIPQISIIDIARDEAAA
jgi:transcriptional regulator with XRE-family HTH domain